eukprot:scaffold3425_cov80-Cylindrotheca_fusiformis.AAC.1
MMIVNHPQEREGSMSSLKSDDTSRSSSRNYCKEKTTKKRKADALGRLNENNHSTSTSSKKHQKLTGRGSIDGWTA